MKTCIFVFIFLMARTSFADCGKFLTMPNNTATTSVTDQFLSFVGTLLEQGVVSSNYLEVLASGKLKNPFSSLRISSDQDIYEPYFAAYLGQSLDKEKIKNWAQEKLRNIRVVGAKKEVTQQKTENAFCEMRFHKIKAGEFVMGPGRYRKEAETAKILIPKNFEMMETKVTESMWVKLMGSVPKTKNQSFPFVLPNGKTVQILPDQPITGITWWEAIGFANRLSALHNLKPAYIIKLHSRKNDAGVEIRSWYTLEINEPSGNIYLTEGFRLPTRAELEFVMSDKGQSPTPYFSTINDSNFNQYAHSDMSIYEVGEKLPVILDGGKFYDLYGNGEEWCTDLTDDADTLTDGSVRLSESIHVIIKKGNGQANNGYSRQASSDFDVVSGELGDRKLSFRLVRSLP